MATSLSYVTYVYEQLQHFNQIRYKKMFGEYMIYIYEKPTLLICDHQVYLKIIESLSDKMNHLEQGYPYQGAKPHYMLNIDDIDETVKMIELVLPYLKVKEKK